MNAAAKVIIYYISPAVSHFYETEYEIWAGFGQVGSTDWSEKYATFEGSFLCFHGQKDFF